MRISKTVQIMASAVIWDSCQAYSAPQRHWTFDYVDSSGHGVGVAQYSSIDTSVKSPLGTGSLKLAIPAGLSQNVRVSENFSLDNTLLLDFSGINRPRSIFVRLNAPYSISVVLITREPSGTAWNSHVIHPSTAIPANTMTELPLDYTGISTSALSMSTRVAVIVPATSSAITVWVSGVTSAASAPPPSALVVTPSPTPGAQGYTTTPFSVNIAWTPNNVSNYGFRVDWGDGSDQPVNTLPNGQGPVAFVTTHQYALSGSYTITVTVTDTNSSAVGTGTVAITVNPVLTVDLTADKTSGNIPLTVNTTNNPEGGFAPYAWTEDYGDGSTLDSGTQTTAGPFTRTHIYTTSGTFTITLTVTDALGVGITAKSAIRAGVIASVGVTPIRALEVIAAIAVIAGGAYATKKVIGRRKVF